MPLSKSFRAIWEGAPQPATVRGVLYSFGLVVLLGTCWATAAEPTAKDSSTSANLSLPSVAPESGELAAKLWRQVTIYRDEWGIPHIDGPTDQAVVFGFAYAQAEDNFWQVEDNYILGLGRYSEAHGPKGLNSDLLNRAFEVTSHARASFDRLEPAVKDLCAGFAAGLNYYLAKNPQVEARLIKHFEPWHVLAYGRQMTLEMCFRYTRLSNNYMPRSNELIWTAGGSNGWAIAPKKTAGGHAMLLVNPHLPWFGYAQLYEAHLRSAEGWNFIGATMFGNPMPIIGHNEQLGWTMTTNEPDVADVWRVSFDKPEEPLQYRFGDTYRQATEWQETIKIKGVHAMRERVVTLRKTDFGPIVARESQSRFLAAQIAKFHESVLLRQASAMVRAKNLEEFCGCLALQQFPIMNIIYADQAGNIMFLYNGLVPRRDPRFNWRAPVDGDDPHTQWQGLHTLDELPKVLNPSSGYVQNCNSSPFTTCDSGNPDPRQFPPYMVEDASDDRRRAKRSREILGPADAMTLENLADAAMDTTLYWARHEMLDLIGGFERLKSNDPDLATRAGPLIKHLLDWDGRVTAESTQATLCETWYEKLYGSTYPAEKLRGQYVKNPDLVFQALVEAQARLIALFGDWRVPWGQVFRVQRREKVADLLPLPFDDRDESLPSLAAPGPMGVIFTQYYSPSLRIPFIRTPRNRYGLIGTSYVAVYEFGPRIRGASALNFGESGDPHSPHFSDQAKLLADRKLAPELFYWDDVRAKAKWIYHPGESRVNAAD